jgi:hypothetical protein
MERMDFMELLGRELTSTLPTTLEADGLFNSSALASGINQGRRTTTAARQ